MSAPFCFQCHKTADEVNEGKIKYRCPDCNRPYNINGKEIRVYVSKPNRVCTKRRRLVPPIQQYFPA
jgi:hypothetical protein